MYFRYADRDAGGRPRQRQCLPSHLQAFAHSEEPSGNLRVGLLGECGQVRAGLGDRNTRRQTPNHTRKTHPARRPVDVRRKLEGQQALGAMPLSGNRNVAGSTPTTVRPWPSRSMVLPMISGSPANLRRHSESVSITARGPSGRSSFARNPRPSAGSMPQNRDEFRSDARAFDAFGLSRSGQIDLAAARMTMPNTTSRIPTQLIGFIFTLLASSRKARAHD
jgi:hypothetical protein